MKLEATKEWILDLVFPKTCLGCKAEGAFLCDICHENLRWGTPSCPVCRTRNFDGIVCGTCSEEIGLRRFLAPFSYRDPLARGLIHAYKYDGVKSIANLLAREAVDFIQFYGVKPPRGSVIVPIPLHRSRLRERGFNQSELLANKFGEHFGLPVVLALRRARFTDQQIDMDSHDARRKNVTDAFALVPRADIAGKTVVLIDDVATSGATLREAAGVLRAAGCRTVWAIVIAKG